MQGIFISFEGPDGSGKSTQIELLKEYLEGKGYEILVTREPGGTKISEQVRTILLDPENSEMGHMTEALLYASARAQLMEEVILPALEQGKAVICDRFVDSSAVYQGIARNLGVAEIYQLNTYATHNVLPALTIHLDLPATAGIARKKDQKELDRMEQESLNFHETVAQGYRDLAAKNPERIHTIDATEAIEEIHKKVVELVAPLLRS